MAWLASDAAVQSGRAGVDWMTSATAGGALPPTRLYLAREIDDWRNSATFVFDLAMAARGVGCFAGAGPLLSDLLLRLENICQGSALLPSHALKDGPAASIPDRWSTRPGPHHAKAAAALLGLPEGSLSDDLAQTCRATVDHWATELEAWWPCDELHPLLYGIEGLLIDGQDLGTVERIYVRLMRMQREDGSLPPATTGGSVRSDVLAQALRAGALLRAAGRLQDDDWQRRLDALAAALLLHVHEDGGVLFALDQERANTWCAMFAQQALVLHARALRGDEARLLV